MQFSSNNTPIKLHKVTPKLDITVSHHTLSLGILKAMTSPSASSRKVSFLYNFFEFLFHMFACFIPEVCAQYFCFELFFIFCIFCWIEMWKKASLSKIASNRLQKELVEWQVNPPTGFKHKVTDNLQRFFFFKYISLIFDLILFTRLEIWKFF